MRRASQLFLLLAALMLGACIEFEEQTVSYHYDSDADTLRLFQNYSGIFGGEAEGEEGIPLSAKEKRQLESVLEGRHSYFFGNWILKFDLDDLEDARADLVIPARLEEMGIGLGDVPKVRFLLDLVLDNVSIKNGPLYLDGGGKLCGVQLITVTKFSKIIAALNDVAPILIAAESDEESTSPEDLEAISAFSKPGAPGFIQLDGNRIALNYPMAAASFEKALGEKAEDKEVIESLRDAGIRVASGKQVVTFSIGGPDEKISSITAGVNTEDYVCNAEDHARALGILREEFDPEAARNEFLLESDKKEE